MHSASCKSRDETKTNARSTVAAGTISMSAKTWQATHSRCHIAIVQTVDNPTNRSILS